MDNSRNIEKMVNMGFRIGQMSAMYANSFMHGVNQFLKYMDRDKSAKLLHQYINRGGDIAVSFCHAEYLNKLDRRLSAEGITHVKAYNSITGENTGMLLYADYNSVKVSKILNQFRSEIGKHGMSEHEAIYEKSDMSVFRIGQLDYYKARLYLEHAKEIEADLAISEENDGSYVIKYNACDQDKVQLIRKIISLELSASAGEALKKQMDFENEKILKIDKMLSDHKFYYEKYVCGLDGSMIHLKNEYLFYYGNEGTFKLDKRNPNFYKTAVGLVATIKQPVILGQKQYDYYKNLTINEKNQFLMQYELKNGRPKLSREEVQSIKLIREKVLRYELKLSLENPIQFKLHYAFENDEMRMAAFIEADQINEFSNEEMKLYEKKMNEELLVTADKIYDELQEEVLQDHMIRKSLENQILSNDLEIDFERIETEYEYIKNCDENEYDGYEMMERIMEDMEDSFDDRSLY